MNNRKKKWLVLDMGGTKTAAAFAELGADGYVLSDRRKVATPHTRIGVVNLIEGLAADYRRLYGISSIGLGLAGQIDSDGGKVVCAPNIPGLNGFNLKEALEKKTGLRVYLKNDVRAFALAEDRFGKYKGSESAVFIAPGTGIGGALKLDGRFYFGRHNIAGEFGHMVVEHGGAECGCGGRGCWERYAGGAGLERMFREEFHEEKSAREILAAARLGDARERQVAQRAAEHLAAGLVSIINVLDPGLIVVGGSMVKGGLLLKLALPLVRRQALPAGRKTRIVASGLGDDAPLIGAAL